MIPASKNIPTQRLPLSTLHFASEAPKGHDLSVRKAWPRKGREWDELSASIKKHGVIFPLVYKDIAGKNYIISGNRRLDVLRTLANGNDPTVPCINVDDYENGDPRLLAYAANINLPPHPVDRYELFSMLEKDGMDRKDLAEQFVLTDRQVSQVLALGRLSSVIRDAWRDGKIDAECAQAFTLTSDNGAQERLFKALNKDGALYANVVRGRLVGKQTGVGRMLKFVGFERYVSAGGSITEDLFENNHTVSDMGLLNRLVEDRFEEEIQRLTATEGWGWAIRASEAPHAFGLESLKTGKPTAKEQKELIRLQREVEATTDEAAIDVAMGALKRLENEIEVRGYTAKLKATAGCLIDIDDDGNLDVRYGLIKPPEKKADAKKDKDKKKPGDISNKLTRDLSHTLKAAVANGVRAAFRIGLEALTTTDEGLRICSALVPEKVMQRMLLKAFDAGAYFKGLSADGLKLAAKNIDAKIKFKPGTKKDAAAKMLAAVAERKGWLPPQLRVPGYKGPGGK